MELVPLREGSPFLAEVSRINDEAFPPFEHVGMDEMLSVLRRDGNGFCAIVEDGKVSGFLLYLLRDDVCFLGFLAVSKEHRSAGIGGRALESLKI